MNFGPGVACQLSHRHNHAVWVYMAVIWITNNDSSIIKIHEGIELFGFDFVDEFEGVADVSRTALYVSKPLFLNFAEANTNAARAMKTRIFTCFLWQYLIVELHRIVIDLSNGLVLRKVWTQACRVPGGSAGKLAFFD